jgi:AraC-like DNA-binding protein
MAETTNTRPAEREAAQVQANREELAERIDRAVRDDGSVDVFPGLRLSRLSSPREPLHSVYEPVFCVIAQGSKEVFLGDERYVYDPAHYLLVTAELPLVSRVREASPARPYLGLRLDLDASMVGSVLLEAGHVTAQRQSAVRAVNASPLDAGLLEAALRLVRLVDQPTEAPFLAPLITREIVYRLWRGAQGDRLRNVAALSGHAAPIALAIERLHRDYAQPLRIDHVARDLGMSVSGLHHHFKAVTAMSPLQFQKRLRLQEARRLLLVEGLDAAHTAYRVGYNDASQFNREYKRLFGLPPLRDVERLRITPGQSAA